MGSISKSKSGYYGVRYRKDRNRYESKITVNGVHIYLGMFKTAIEAARKFDEYVIANNLTRVRLNFPLPEPYNDIPNTRWIRLTQRQFARVDDYNYDWLNQFTWRALKDGNTYYAMTSIKVGNRYVGYLMHRLILGIIDFSIKVDHINHNGTDNYNDNIRMCTNSQNQMNRSVLPIGNSRHKGVYFDKRYNKYYAQNTIDGKQLYLGGFELEDDAGRCYNISAIKNFGVFACLNKDKNGITLL